MTRSGFIVLLVGLGIGQPAMGQGMEGRWKLMAAEDLRADGTVGRYNWGPSPVGSIVIENGVCFFQMMAGEVPAFPKGETTTVEQMKAKLSSSYLAYSGPCTIDQTGKMTITIAAASVPDYASPQIRHARVAGDTLFFGPTDRVLASPPWASVPEGQLIRRLRLERVR